MVVDLEVCDTDGFQEYRTCMPSLNNKYGGKSLVRAASLRLSKDRDNHIGLCFSASRIVKLSGLFLMTPSV